MKLIVKTFLENNIELIDSHQWEQFFYKWYAFAGDNIYPWDQNEIEKELFNVLLKVDIPMSFTEQARKNVIKTCLEGAIQDILYDHADNSTPYYIRWNLLLGNLNSFLGFEMDDLYKILIEISTDKGLTYNTEYRKYIVNV